MDNEILIALREKYKPGTRVELIQMDDDPYSKLEPGDKGTVTGVDDLGSLLIDWDCGSSLNLLYGIDDAVIINEPELMPCPRCCEMRMKLPLAYNAWSRYADVYICDFCGMDEALRDAFGKEPLPFDEWAVNKQN